LMVPTPGKEPNGKEALARITYLLLAVNV